MEDEVQAAATSARDEVAEREKQENQNQKKCESNERAHNGFRAFRLALMRKHFETKEDTKLHRVADGVFIGSFGAALDVEALRAHNITHIVCATDTLPLLHEDTFTYLRVSIKDNPFEAIRHHFHPTNAFIQDAVDHQGGVLVHCLAGVSRSATICVAYLMEKHQLRLADALERVTRCRPNARPNGGFMSQLKAFEQEMIEHAHQ